jgi:hypothetical protein
MSSVDLKQLLKFALFSIAPLALAGLSGCNPCRDEILDKTTSPDGKLAATTLARDCGATTSELMGVNLQDVKQKHLETQNEVFVTMHIHRGSVQSFSHIC